EKIIGKDFVESYGGRVLTIPFEYDISTSQIIEKIINLYC
ncbi:MAG TPA: D-glycero-beta-D-manno-heptose 1-phosphate adenylyltransferase, partial [Aquifex aeolicus]|nr:D-glycero-beta-D-manno-heptose 1-phosphate adenylyltransferase [Aquifex aeolicus]